jgi:hypothetical protein
MVLMRRELGDVLREERRAQKRSLRDVSASAAVSLGYLSEIERGEKEASSELLGAICEALGLPLSALLRELSVRVAQAEGFATLSCCRCRRSATSASRLTGGQHLRGADSRGPQQRAVDSTAHALRHRAAAHEHDRHAHRVSRPR